MSGGGTGTVADEVCRTRSHSDITIVEQSESDPNIVVIKRSFIGVPLLGNFEVSCGKGTYMRALARDLGVALGTRAHIIDLRRLSVGPFAESDAISLEKLESFGHSPAAFEQLLPIEAALDDIPALSLAPTEASRIRCGQAVSLMARIYRERIAEWRDGETIFVTSGGKPVALMRYTAGELHPVRVLNL